MSALAPKRSAGAAATTVTVALASIAPAEARTKSVGVSLAGAVYKPDCVTSPPVPVLLTDHSNAGCAISASPN